MTDRDRNDKFELTAARHPDNPVLRRIRALRDIPRAGVKAGDLGGWVESPDNLSVFGDAWVYGTAWVSGAARVFGDAWVYGTAWVSGAARVYGDAWVYGDDHTITAGPLSSVGGWGTLARQKDGTGRIVIDCWAGTVDDLRALAVNDDWPSECDEETRVRYRPRLLAFAALCDAQIALWEPTPAEAGAEQ